MPGPARARGAAWRAASAPASAAWCRGAVAATCACASTARDRRRRARARRRIPGTRRDAGVGAARERRLLRARARAPGHQRLGHLRRDRRPARRSARRSLRAFPFAAYVSKTITLEPRAGNPPPRLWEARGGLINSIGLPNKGLEGYLAEDLPALAELLADADAGAAADSVADADARRAADHERDGRRARTSSHSSWRRATPHPEIAAVELNVSCPNVQHRPRHRRRPRSCSKRWSRSVRGRTGKPLIVKLTPNTADVAACAQARRGRRRGRRVADQHAARDGAAPRRDAGGRPLARRGHRRPLGARDPRRRARAGGRRGGARGDPGGRHGRRAERARTRATCSTWAQRWSPSAPRASATRAPARA